MKKKVIVPRPYPVEVIPKEVIEDIVPEKEEEMDEMDGEGNVIGALLPKRKAGKFPPKSRALLKQVGNEKVTSLTVERSPISIGRVINWLTLGYYDKAVQETQYPHDKMFHLRLIINGKYIVEKNQVLKFAPVETVSLKEMMKVPLPKKFDKTINDMLDTTKKNIGDKRFTSYSAKYQNCQLFVKDILKSNGLLNPDLNSFIVQNTKKFFEAFPKFFTRLVKRITNTSARIDRLIEGEGIKKRKRCPPLMLENGIEIPDTRCEKKK